MPDTASMADERIAYLKATAALREADCPVCVLKLRPSQYAHEQYHRGLIHGVRFGWIEYEYEGDE